MRAITGVTALAVVVGITAADAADLRMPVKAPVMPVVVYNWTGFYVGGNVGYSWGDGRGTLDGSIATTTRTRTFRTATGPGGIGSTDVTVGPVVATATASDTASIDGWLGGAQLGYNWQSGPWVLGLETDFQWTGERGGSRICLPPACPVGGFTLATDYRIKWFGTFRGRAGWLVDPRVLLYATGGLAYGRIDTSYTSGFVGLPLATVTNSQTRLGWTVGAGVEGALDNNWSIKAEYLYVDYGRYSTALGGATNVTSVTLADTPQTAFTTIIDTTVTASGTARARVTDHVVRIGVNYRFAPAAVVARY